MALNNEDEFGTRPASEAERLAWDAGNIRGVRAQFNGQRVDNRGNRYNELLVVDDEFETRAPAIQGVQHPANCQCIPCQEKNFKYMNWHQKGHKSIPHPDCVICQAQQRFRSEHPELVGRRVGVDG